MAELIANEQAQQGNTNDAVDNVGQDDRQGDEEEKNDDTVPVGHGAFENALEGAAFIKPVGQAYPGIRVNEVIESFENSEKFIHGNSPL